VYQWYQSGAGYYCYGENHGKTSRTGADSLSVNPKRKKFKIADNLMKRHNFLKMYKSKIGTGPIPNLP
jgi:hypothetical protein